MYLRLSRFIGRIAVIVLLVAAVSVTGVRTAQAEALVVQRTDTALASAAR